MRLHKYLAQCGVASRRQAETLIAAGRVEVNGKVAIVGESIDPDVDDVTFDGKLLNTSVRVYILLNKPRDVITSVKDTHNRKTVLDCLNGVRSRVYPVGRLDMDVEGALLLTNDGEMAYRLTHPKYQIEKVYLVWVDGIMNTQSAMQIEKGVPLDDGMTAPANIVILNYNGNSTLIRLTLREGRKREVKRMCSHVGHPVRELRRVSVGNVRLRGLRPGEWRYLSESELGRLRELTHLSKS